MICPKCKRDYKDVPEGKPPGHVYRIDDHYYMKEKRSCMICSNCGFAAEVVTKPTGENYFKRKIINDQNQKNNRTNKSRVAR